MRIDNYRAWTLTVINLTEFPLSLGNQLVTASNAQRPPFNGNTLNGQAAFPLAPYQNVTWKSNTATAMYPQSRWNGILSVFPRGMDPTEPDPTKSKWTVTLNFSEQWFDDCSAIGVCYNHVGTWVYLTADVSGNPDWQDGAAYSLSCSYPTDYNTTYNVMTLSGTDLVAVLYAPYVNILEAPSVNITLVIRQRWPHIELPNGYQDSIVAPCLTYQDNNGNWLRK